MLKKGLLRSVADELELLNEIGTTETKFRINE